MKLSTWYKQNGDLVEWYDPIKALCDGEYDKVYMSKVFTFTQDYDNMIYAKEIVRGGTGYYYPDGGQPLQDAIEHSYPDYDLYGIKDTAYGFLTRGCPRNCKFCIVGCKEGLISHKVADLSEFWRGQKNIELLDPNILACKEHKELLQQLIDSKAKVNINQGADCRLLTEDNINLLKQIRLSKIHFAWDNYSDMEKVLPKLKLYTEMTDCDMRKTIVYVLTNFNSSFEEDLERVYKIREVGMAPYIMIYDKQTAQRNVKQLARWVNNRFIWFKDLNSKFEDYNK